MANEDLQKSQSDYRNDKEQNLQAELTSDERQKIRIALVKFEIEYIKTFKPFDVESYVDALMSEDLTQYREQLLSDSNSHIFLGNNKLPVFNRLLIEAGKYDDNPRHLRQLKLSVHEAYPNSYPGIEEDIIEAEIDALNAAESNIDAYENGLWDDASYQSLLIKNPGFKKALNDKVVEPIDEKVTFIKIKRQLLENIYKDSDVVPDEVFEVEKDYVEALIEADQLVEKNYANNIAKNILRSKDFQSYIDQKLDDKNISIQSKLAFLTVKKKIIEAKDWDKNTNEKQQAVIQHGVKAIEFLLNNARDDVQSVSDYIRLYVVSFSFSKELRVWVNEKEKAINEKLANENSSEEDIKQCDKDQKALGKLIDSINQAVFTNLKKQGNNEEIEAFLKKLIDIDPDIDANEKPSPLQYVKDNMINYLVNDKISILGEDGALSKLPEPLQNYIQPINDISNNTIENSKENDKTKALRVKLREAREAVEPPQKAKITKGPNIILMTFIGIVALSALIFIPGAPLAFLAAPIIANLFNIIVGVAILATSLMLPIFMKYFPSKKSEADKKNDKITNFVKLEAFSKGKFSNLTKEMVSKNGFLQEVVFPSTTDSPEEKVDSKNRIVSQKALQEACNGLLDLIAEEANLQLEYDQSTGYIKPNEALDKWIDKKLESYEQELSNLKEKSYQAKLKRGSEQSDISYLRHCLSTINKHNDELKEAMLDKGTEQSSTPKSILKKPTPVSSASILPNGEVKENYQEEQHADQGEDPKEEASTKISEENKLER